MLGLATVLTEQGMEGIIAFVPPAAPRPAPAQLPAADALASAEAAGPVLALATRRMLWLAGAGLAALVVVGLLGYLLVAQLTGAGQGRKAASARPAASRPVLDDAASRAPAPPPAADAEAPPPSPASSPPAAEPAATPPPQAASTPLPRPVAPEPLPRPAAVRKPPPRQSEFVPQPEWTSQVRKVGEVDAQTEQATMKIMEAIHAVQEREQAASAAKKGGHKP